MASPLSPVFARSLSSHDVTYSFACSGNQGRLEDDEEEEDGFEVYVFEVSDDDADALLGSNPAWKSYADRELRHAAGLRAYFYLDSY